LVDREAVLEATAGPETAFPVARPPKILPENCAQKDTLRKTIKNMVLGVGGWTFWRWWGVGS